MAIYHLNIKTISRAKGHSAVASIAYRRAEHMHDARYEKIYDYTAKCGVIHSEMTIPNNAPGWMFERVRLHETQPRLASEQFWNFVELCEERKDAQLAREIEFSLPLELTKEQNIQLAREYIEDQFALRGMVADWSVHWDKGNPHVHVMLTMRALTDMGFGKKVRAWNSKALMCEWREKWAEYANFHLKKHQHDITIDHRSYREQGIALAPGIHHGGAVLRMQAQGIETTRMQEANHISLENLTRIAVNPDVLLHKVERQSPTFTQNCLAHELSRYIDQTPNADEALLSHETIATILQDIEQHHAVFGEAEIVKAVSRYTEHADVFARAVLALKASPQLMPLGVGDDGRERFTTSHMFEIENKAVQISECLRDRAHQKISLVEIEATLKTYERTTGKALTAEQQHALKHLLKPSDISCLVGRAGTGKSFLLGAARAVWENAGYSVHGVALSGIAADGLSKDAGIQSRTIASFMSALEKKHITLSHQSIVVMDEAGMTDTPSMLAVMEAIHTSGAQLRLVGDPAQLQPVGPGAVFRGIVERIGFAEIQTIYRQKETWQQQATIDLAAGRVDKAIDAYHEKEAVHIERDSALAMQRLSDDWIKHRAANPATAIKEYLVIAYENKDVAAINQMLRNIRMASGEIAEGYTVSSKAGEMQISKDDRILFLKNDRLLGVNNGRFATIESVNFTESGQVIDFVAKLDGSDNSVLIDPETYSDFAYGYAATVHKVQGVTVDHTFNYVGKAGWNRHTTYVAASRHRKTCDIYASSEDYKDLTALKKGLSRYGIKDSVLDFPLAFATRRSIDASEHLPKQLAQRLSHFKEKLSDRYLALVDPKVYWNKKEALAQERARIEQLTQTRENARLVAHYVDKKRDVGLAWQTLQQKLSSVGLGNMSYLPEDMAIISNTPEYTQFQKAILERDVAALPLAEAPERFTKAFDIYGLELSKIASEAQSHQYRQHVSQYQIFLQSGQSVLRDRLAATIMKDIKAYYPHLKSAGVDTKAIRAHGVQHLRRALLSTLSREERKLFYVVEDYQLTSQNIGKSYATLKEKNVANISLPQKFLEKREALAAQILENKAHAKPALAFFQIGHFTPVFGAVDEAHQISYQQQAEERLQKLEKSALRHYNAERVKAYISACTSKDAENARKLAHEIMGDTKAHHGAVLNNTGIPSILWSAIRKDAKLYVRDRFFETLAPEKQQNFLLVEAYVAEKRASAQAWAGIFEVKELGIPESQWKDILLPLTKAPTHAKNKLAASIHKDMDACKEGMEFFEVDPTHLEKAAYAHLCKGYVEFYQSEKNVMLRANLATIIAQDPKSHHPAILDAGVSWQQLYKHRKPAQQKHIFSTLSPHEKKLWRWAARYRQANQAVGKSYAKISAIKKVVDPTRQAVMNTLMAKRDYLAHQLVEAKRTVGAFTLVSGVDKDPFQALQESHPINWEKVNQQAQSHQEKTEHVKTWQGLNQSAVEILPHLLHKQGNSEKVNVNERAYYDWLAISEDSTQATKSISSRLDRYTYALLSAGTSKDAFKHTQENQLALKQALSQSTQTRQHDDPMLQTRIERARHIERGTKPIQNTLAERYLREHRGIQGVISSSYRYHPALYNGETKQKLPALVVIAKNPQKETNAVQVIFLDKLTGNKAKLNTVKLTYGTLTQENTAVLVNAGKNAKTIAIAEGPETALSISEANPDLRVYAVLGSSNFTRAPIHKDTQKILFCADNDGKDSASQKKLLQAANTLSQKGLEIWQAMPDKEKQDFNDVLKIQGKEVVRTLLSQATLLKTAEKKLSIQHRIDAIVSESHPSDKQQAKSTQEDLMTPEREERYKMIINKYRELKWTRDTDPYKQPMHQIDLEEYAYRMSERPRLMRYIETRFSNMFKNIRTLSKSRTLEQDLSIER